MFKLSLCTEAHWAEKQLPHLSELLLEHAHLERKAASAALTLMFRYPQHGFLQKPLSEVAREELEHFEQVLELMARRNIAFGPVHPSPYANQLLQVQRGQEPQRLLDQLLCAAVIEARSCERMKLLAQAFSGVDAEISSFYAELVTSEARHYVLYLGLAEKLFSKDEVQARLDQVVAHEAKVLEQAPEGPRMHNA